MILEKSLEFNKTWNVNVINERTLIRIVIKIDTKLSIARNIRIFIKYKKKLLSCKQIKLKIEKTSSCSGICPVWVGRGDAAQLSFPNN